MAQLDEQKNLFGMGAFVGAKELGDRVGFGASVGDTVGVAVVGAVVGAAVVGAAVCGAALGALVGDAVFGTVWSLIIFPPGLKSAGLVELPHWAA